MKRILLLLRKKSTGVLSTLFLLLPILSHAGTITVSTTADLINALTTADGEPATTATIINMNPGTYMMSSGIVFGATNGESVTINAVGPGATILQMTGQDRFFIINTTATVPSLTVTFNGITFRGGQGGTDGDGGGAVLCGGPSNVTTFQNCIFTNNKASIYGFTFDNGGAIAQEGGGQLNITNCTFTNNSIQAGEGGAIFYFQDNFNGGLSVTNSTFTGNSTAGGATPAGGALFIDITKPSGAESAPISVTGNVFTNNSASSTGDGGAIDIENGVTTTAVINYNRFYGNTGGFPDVAMASVTGGGPVDITNNWWGRNVSPVSATDPHAGIVSGGSGSLISSPWLELTCTGSAASLCGGSGGNSTVVTASFAKNSAGTTISSANLGAFLGVPISFTSTQGIFTNAQTTTQTGGTATATFTDNGTAGTDNIQPVADSVTSTDGIADDQITINAPSLATGSASGTVTVSSGTPEITNGSCNQICLVTPSGASPVSGSVTASVTIDGSLQSASGQPYLTRHYDIEPAAGASAATATITLYYLQSEFNMYNASVSNPSQELPTGPSDQTGRGNLTITQFHGTGTVPGSYTGWTGTGPASVLITPGASNVVWNSTKSWWEVSFSVTGFSGFFVTGPISVPLPVVLEGFGGVTSGSGVLLSWKVGEESGLAHYEVQRSDDGVSFASIGDAGVGARAFFDGAPLAGKNFYQLKMVNDDGSFTYSQVVVVDVTGASGGWVRVLNNPFAGACSVVITAEASGPASMRLADVSGKVLWVSQMTLGPGANTLELSQTASLASGLYFLTVVGPQGMETIKLLKQ